MHQTKPEANAGPKDLYKVTENIAVITINRLGFKNTISDNFDR